MRRVSSVRSHATSLVISASPASDSSQEFLQMKMLTYMFRFLDTNQNFDRECFQVQHWLLGHELDMVLLESIVALGRDKERRKKTVSEEDIDDGWDFGRICRDMIKFIPKNRMNQIGLNSKNLLKKRLEELTYQTPTIIEENMTRAIVQVGVSNAWYGALEQFYQ